MDPFIAGSSISSQYFWYALGQDGSDRLGNIENKRKIQFLSFFPLSVLKFISKVVFTAVSVLQFCLVKCNHLALFNWNSLKAFFGNMLKKNSVAGVTWCHLSVMPTNITLTFHILEKYLTNHVTHLTWHTVTKYEVITSY